MTINQPNLKDIDAAIEEVAATGSSQVEKITVSSLVHQYLEAQNLNVLSESLIQNAVDEFVGKGDKDAVSKYVSLLDAMQARLTVRSRIDCPITLLRAVGSRSSSRTRATRFSRRGTSRARRATSTTCSMPR